MANIHTIPIIQSHGVAAKGVGRAGVMLSTDERANASMIARRDGVVDIFIVASANEPNPAVQIFRGLAKGMGSFQEEWIPQSGPMTIGIQGTDFSQRVTIFQGIQVQEGEFIGVAIQNKQPNFRLGLCGVFMQYH
jgi:hypothetical protein